MRILYLASRLPFPPDRGDRLRAYHFLEHLAPEHEVTLITFAAREAEREHLAGLRPFCREIHTLTKNARQSAVSAAANVWRREPLQALYYRSRAMQCLVDRVVAGARAEGRPFQVAVAHLFRMAPYLERCAPAYRIVDLTDVISQEIARSLPYRRYLWRTIYRFEEPRIRRYERWTAESFDEAWLVSQADRAILADRCSKANLRWVPNGVDAAHFFPTGEPIRPDSLLFVGHLGVQHNIDAATVLVREVLPRVQEQVPGCTLEIVGASPGREVRRLAGRPGVTVTGYVPDLNRHLNQAAAFVAPLRFAAGVQNKVLEAMACGRPVVTTPMVSAGLGAQPGRDLLAAVDAVETANAVVALLRDDGLRRQIGQAGLDLVRRAFSWDQVACRMREIEASFGGAGST